MSDEFKAFEVSGWDAAAATYDSLTGRATAHAFEPLLDLARVDAGARVLDVGCGPGGLTAAAAARGAEPTGVDLAEAMIGLARRNHPGLRFEQGDAEAMPFEDGCFDAVVGAFVLNHLPDPPSCVAEAFRVGVPAGRAAFAVWDRPERARLTSLLADATERAGFDRRAGVPEGPDDRRYADPDEMTALLLQSGFIDIETDVLEVEIAVEDFDALWNGLLGGTVRSAMAVRRAGPEGETRVRRALTEVAEEFADGEGGYAVPTVICLGSGSRRPA